jgi:hypothetical protein
VTDFATASERAPRKAGAIGMRVIQGCTIAPCLIASLILLAGCVQPTVETVYACLEDRLPGRIGFAEWPMGSHITIDQQAGTDATTRIWISERVEHAKRIEMNRKGNRTMGVFGMFYSGGVERRGHAVVEFPSGKPPEELRRTVLRCLR